MSTDDALTEKVARAICYADRIERASCACDGECEGEFNPHCPPAILAVAAISTIRQHDAESGMVMVPREPTPRILVAMDAVSAALSFASGRTEGNRGRYAAIITATLTAAQEATTDG